MAITSSVKYVFLDIVAFTYKRSVEAQADIIEKLNEFVTESINGLSIDRELLILLPTGDGMCIAMLNLEHPYDIHMQLALAILEKIEEYNEATVDVMRQFEIRIGINTNVDNLVTDIRGQRNVAGAGINTAQRVMSQADGSMIMISQSVQDVLSNREKYNESFQKYTTQVKHGIYLTIYQYIQQGLSGLKTNVPSNFVPAPATILVITKLIAFYMAHAIINKDLMLQTIDKPRSSYAGVLGLWFIAKDSLALSRVSEIDDQPSSDLPTSRKDGFLGVFDYFMSLDISVLYEFSSCIKAIGLEKYGRYFMTNNVYRLTDFRFLNPDGIERLRAEHLDIWETMQLGNYIKPNSPT